MSIFLLGVDPGFANFGYSVVEVAKDQLTLVDAGVFRTEKSDKKRSVLASDDNLRRARELAKAVSGLLDDWDIYAFCAESMSFPRNASAAAKVAMSWGILATFAEEQGKSLVQASPQEIKKQLCGRKDASKEEVEAEVVKRLGSFEGHLEGVASSYREHAYDAAGAILVGLQSEVIRGVVGRL